jgi:hypothetical protein
MFPRRLLSNDVGVIDANRSDDASNTPRNEGGVLANLPRTRPQRLSPRRTAARQAAGAANGAGRPRRSAGSAGEAAGKPGGPATRPNGRTAERPTAKTSTKPPAKATAKPAPKRRRAGTGKRSAPPQDAAPRQGFECDGETASGAVQPPGGAEFVATAAEIVGEFAKAGLSTGERLLKDVISRLPLS